MVAKPPLSDDEKATVASLHGQGKSVTHIAGVLGRSTSTVARYARRVGLEFDRSRTEAATAAKTADNRARRAALVEWQYRRAMRLAARLDGDSWTTATRTQTGCLTDDLGFVPTDDELSAARAIGQYVKTAAELEKVDAASGADGAKSMLLDLAAALRGETVGDRS